MPSDTDGYYVLCDGGGYLCKKIVTPYQGKRYHLKEFGLGSECPEDAEELFDLRHSIVRASRAEITIGLLKSRFRLLTVGLGKPRVLSIPE